MQVSSTKQGHHRLRTITQAPLHDIIPCRVFSPLCPDEQSEAQRYAYKINGMDLSVYSNFESDATKHAVQALNKPPICPTVERLKIGKEQRSTRA